MESFMALSYTVVWVRGSREGTVGVRLSGYGFRGRVLKRVAARTKGA
jgi:hypothetical protein